MKKANDLWYPGLTLTAIFAATTWFYSVQYLAWNEPLYGLSMAVYFIVAAGMTALLAAAKGRSKKACLLRGLIGGAVWLLSVFAASYVINVMIFHERGAAQATLATACMSFAFALAFIVLLRRRCGRKSFFQPFVGVALSVCVLAGGLFPLRSRLTELLYKNSKRMEAIPMGLSSYTEKERPKADGADLYVSPAGSDENDGSFEHPLATPEKARDLVRAMDKTGRSGITVAFMAGEYRVKSLVFTEEDSGTKDCPVTYCAYGDGEVILNGGMTLDPAAFGPVTDEAMRSRLRADAQDHVVCVDLGALGITAADYGKIYTIGSYNTASHYSGDWEGPLYCELFVNDVRCNLARYPDTGWLETGAVVKMGYGRESDGSATKVENWEEVRDPASDIYKVDDALADRIHGWATLDDVWMFGFWKYTWADASTPIGEFSYENKTLSPKFVSVYGAIKGAPYYFFNVFEELDAPGEWYLDRAKGVLYLYAPENMEDAVIDLSLTTETLIAGENVHDLVFDGFTIKGTRGDAVRISGDRNTVKRCLIKNVAGTALVMEGYENLASENEITRTGKAGIVIAGGDRETLTPGNSKADNNLIHDWSEIYQTYQPAVTLSGAGNVCSHNEIYNSPHEAITYDGNDHVIEYNLIHDVCLISDDAGAIYSGRHWDWYGNVIRYNAIYNLGTPGKHNPQGIYMDDALSGQTIYGNLLVNIPCFGLQFGGGRDLIAQNNIVINTKNHAVSFDQRAIDGVLEGGWFGHCDEMWDALEAMPWQSDAWQQAYPALHGLHFDETKSDDPMFAANAANGKVTGNLFVNERGELGDIQENPAKFSDVSGNAIYKMNMLDELFTDPANGDYTLRPDAPVFDLIPDFEPLPLGEIGRY